MYTYWNASVGGKDPARAYRSYVKEGLNAKEHPFRDELCEWVFGSEDFLRRMVALADGASGVKGIDSVSNLVRRAEKRYKQLAAWQKTANEIETMLKLNTEHKA